MGSGGKKKDREAAVPGAGSPEPARFGRYEVIRLLGRGAMGRVYLAHDPQIDRQVALKVFCAVDFVSQAEASDASLRFQREARSAGKLTHPNVVVIYDVGEDGPYSFIAMEYVDGRTLSEHTRGENLLPPREAIEIVARAARALGFAHTRQILHRDVKPANMMLTAHGDLKLTDFGLAKEFGASVTRSGALVGTPNYMSPEQIMSRAVDGRSDLFSLGVVLYELLSGERPFYADSISAVIYKILHEEPRALCERAFQLPRGAERVLERALAKDPDKRYQTGEEMASDLERLLERGLDTLPDGDFSPPTRRLDPDDTMMPAAPSRLARKVSPVSFTAGHTSDTPAPPPSPATPDGAIANPVPPLARNGRRIALIAAAAVVVALGAFGAMRWLGGAPEPSESLLTIQNLEADDTVTVDGRIAQRRNASIVLPASPGPFRVIVESPCFEKWERLITTPVVDIKLDRRAVKARLGVREWTVESADEDGFFPYCGLLWVRAKTGERRQLQRKPGLSLPEQVKAWEDELAPPPAPVLDEKGSFRLDKALAGGQVKVVPSTCVIKVSGLDYEYSCPRGVTPHFQYQRCDDLIWFGFDARKRGQVIGDAAHGKLELWSRYSSCNCKITVGTCEKTVQASGQAIDGTEGEWKYQCKLVGGGADDAQSLYVIGRQGREVCK